VAVIHIARNPSIVILSDRDGFGFVHDRVPAETVAMTVSGGGVARTSDVVKKDERCLQWYPIKANGVGGVPRTCVYFDGETAVTLREIISPTFNYDRSSNLLYMNFWTNFKSGYTGAYDPSQLRLVNEDDFDSEEQDVMALCTAVGTFGYYDVTGGDIPSGFGAGSSSSYSGLVPVFYKPIVVQHRQIPDNQGVSKMDIAGVGGGTIFNHKFMNTGGSAVGIHDTLIPDENYISGMTQYIPEGATDPVFVLALKKADVDVPSVGYICTSSSVGSGAVGVAGYIYGPSWVRYSLVGGVDNLEVGFVLGISKDNPYLTVDVPGFRVLAIKDFIISEQTVSMALVAPDHRPIIASVDTYTDPENDATLRVLRDDKTLTMGGTDINVRTFT
jgi:hypothetical protein